MSTAVRRPLIAFLVLASLLGAGLAYWIMWAPNTPDYEEARGVIVSRGASFPAVVDSLESARVLEDATSFRLFGRLTGWDEQIKTGYYEIESGVSNLDLLGRLRRGEQTPLRVTVPPGTRPSVLTSILERDLDLDSAAVRSALRDSALAAELGTRPDDLFGFLLPDTYRFYWNTSAEAVIRRLKQAFDRAYTDEMAARADSLGLTQLEVVTLASIIQWESSRDEQQRRIAGVYLNRLRAGMPLQADPTVQYAILQRTGRRKSRLLYEDYETPHPYNTYRNRGLPPGPITNPALGAIRAVLEAEEHEYRFFVADGKGGHVFSRTFEQHRQAAADYRRLMRERREEETGP